MARPWARVLLVASLAVAACGDDDTDTVATSTTTTSTTSTTASTTAPTTVPVSTSTTSTTTTTSAPTDPDNAWLVEVRSGVTGPDVLVTAGRTLERVTDGEVQPLGVEPARLGIAVGDGAGTIVYERVADDVDTVEGLVVIDDDGPRPIDTGPASDLLLFDLVRIDGAVHVLYSVIDETAGEADGDLVLHDLGTGDRTVLAQTAAPESFTHAGSAAAGTIALSSYADLTEVIAFIDYEGATVDRPSPTDDLPYNAPPAVVEAVLSPDGREMAHLEGPDVDGTSDSGELVGLWRLVVTEDDGSEQLRLTIGGQDLDVLDLDFDGRWAVVSARLDGELVRPLLIDTESVDVPAHLLPRPGRATIDIAG